MARGREGLADHVSGLTLERGFDSMQPTDPAADRLIQIESALMHLTHDVEAMHQAIVAQQREVDAMRRALEQLETAWERDEGLASERRDSQAEKPPHY
jgi:uncharacterized coiled-coil protein SlyX